MQTDTQEISQEAAQAMVVALRHLLSDFPDPIMKPRKRLRIHEAATLNGAIVAAIAALDAAEAR